MARFAFGNGEEMNFCIELEKYISLTYLFNQPRYQKTIILVIQIIDHEFGQLNYKTIYIQNLFQFNNPNDDEITVSIESHVMNLKVTRKSSQSYVMKQQPSVHIKLPGRHGISSPFSIGIFEKNHLKLI